MSRTVKKTGLAKLQANFISDCLSGRLSKDSTLLTENIDNSVISATGLMGIYQSSALANITQALSITYPVIEKLVGEEFFRATCRQYIYVAWPESGNMDDYGADFPEFLAAFEHAKHLVYLKDVARLEWAFHQSSLDNDANITDWSTLAQVTDILKLKFVLAPSFRLVNSRFPVDQIWQLNQVNTSPELDLTVNHDDDKESTDTFLVLNRQGLKTVITPLTYDEFTLLQAFENGENFEQAIILATAKQADISMDNCLKKLIELGIVCGFI